jgi:hypothetical protein
LVAWDLSGGAELLEELDRAQVPVAAAFWRYPSGGSDRRLVIATALVDREGRLAAYGHIQSALDRLPGIRLSLLDVVVIGERDPMVRHLRQHLPARYGPEDFPVSITFPDAYSSAPYLPDDEVGVTLYVYRLAPATDQATKVLA